MTQPAQRPATYEDLRRVPDHLLAQIVHGQLITLPSRAPRYSIAASLLSAELIRPFQKGVGDAGGSWWILLKPEIHFGPDVLVPDVAGWRRECLPEIPDAAYFEQVPNWVCEVLSPDRARLDRVEKLPIYAAQGIGHAWLIDPDARTLEVFALHEGHWLLLQALKDDEEVRAAPFDAIAFSLANLWP